MRCAPGTACRRCKKAKRKCDGRLLCCQRCRLLGVTCKRSPDSSILPLHQQFDIITLMTDKAKATTADHITSKDRENKISVSSAITSDKEAEEDKNDIFRRDESKKFVSDDFVDGLMETYKSIEGPFH